MKKVAKTISEFLINQDEECLITEKFKVNDEYTYIVSDLDIETEDGEILFYDSSDIIQNNDKSVIRHFLEDSVMSIEIIDNILTIMFSDGEVTIEFI